MVNWSRLFLQGRLLQGSLVHAAALVEVAAQLHYITKLHYIAKMQSHLIIMLGRLDVQCLSKQRRFQERLQDIVKSPRTTFIVMLAQRNQCLGLHRRCQAQLDAGEAL